MVRCAREVLKKLPVLMAVLSRASVSLSSVFAKELFKPVVASEAILLLVTLVVRRRVLNVIAQPQSCEGPSTRRTRLPSWISVFLLCMAGTAPPTACLAVSVQQVVPQLQSRQL